MIFLEYCVHLQPLNLKQNQKQLQTQIQLIKPTFASLEMNWVVQVMNVSKHLDPKSENFQR